MKVGCPKCESTNTLWEMSDRDGNWFRCLNCNYVGKDSEQIILDEKEMGVKNGD